MLQAKRVDGTTIMLTTYSREEIEKMRKEEVFYCPTCHEQVIIKAGTKVIPHFAHRQQSTCVSNGGEGYYHQQGKLMLYDWLKRQGMNVSLEVFLADINQRADIILQIKDRTIAIEYQCSVIEAEVIKQRSIGYKRIGITPIWILGANLFERIGKNDIKVNQMMLQCMHQFAKMDNLHLYFFCPQTLQLAKLQNIYLTTVTKASANILMQKLPHIRFTYLFSQPKSNDTIYKWWLKEKRHFRLRRRHHLYGQERRFHQWLYHVGTHVEHLPSIIYLPTKTQMKMKSPPWDWQSRICMDIIHPLPIGQTFTITNCIKYLRPYLLANDHYPLLHADKHPIKEYLNQLQTLRVIKKVSPQKYKKLKSITFYNHIEEALEGDKLVIQELITYNAIKYRNKIH